MFKKVDVMCLPVGFSTGSPPKNGMCDHCKKTLNEGNGKVLVCGHGYHLNCYSILNNGCNHCEQYYKKGIYKNVDSFLKRLEKGKEELTEEDIENPNAEEGDEEEQDEVELNIDNRERMSIEFHNALNNI